MLFGIFSKITRREALSEKIESGEPGLYFYFIFPIAVAFLLTFGVARLINYLFPDLFLIVSGVHVHHFAYGFFVLAVSGFLALLYDDARSKYFISMFHGIGLGLALDEFGMWLRLRDDDIIRWGYDGLLLFLGFIFLIISAKTGVKTLKALWPFNRPAR